MYQFLYSCVFYLAIPFVLLRLLKRSIKEPGYRQALPERFGFFRSRAAGDVVWIHAVSAGETIAAAPLVKRLEQAGYACLVTNMTPTGRERAQVLLGGSKGGSKAGSDGASKGVENCYAPYDLPGSISRFLERNRPRALVTIDTELWPNMISACKRRSIPVAIVNGRMAVRSAAGYARFPGLMRPMMQSLDLIAVQTSQHAERFVALGADPAKVHVTGSIKFDGEYSQEHEARLDMVRKLTGDRPIILGASTHEGEEEALLSVLPYLESVLTDVLVVLAPRHTHRSDHVSKLCHANGYPARRFSEVATNPLNLEDKVLLLDVMGELESYFPIARAAFVGGSLVPVGGHNLLEAVRAGTAVIMGPHLDNIEDIAQQFIDNEAMLVVQNQDQLKDEVVGLMRDAGRTRQLVQRADEVLKLNRGSIDRAEDLLRKLIEGE